MDLLSLSNEMLASVFKYSKHESLQKARRMNHRIDEIAKKNKLDGLVFCSLRINYERRTQTLEVQAVSKPAFSTKEMENNIRRVIKISHDRFTDKLDEVAGKIRKCRRIILSRMVINDAVVEVIRKYAQLFRNSLMISDCHINISAETLMNWANFLELSEIFLHFCTLEDPLTDEEFGPIEDDMYFGVLYEESDDTGELQKLLKSEFGTEYVRENHKTFHTFRTSQSIAQKGVVSFQFSFEVHY